MGKYYVTSREEEFVAMIPATGWVAVWDDGAEDPISCWRMQRDGTVTGWLMDSKGHGEDPATCPGFTGYFLARPNRSERKARRLTQRGPDEGSIRVY